MMMHRFRLFTKFSRILPRIHSGIPYVRHSQDAHFFMRHSKPFPCEHVLETNITMSRVSFRLSTTAEVLDESPSQFDLLPFIESTLHDFEGPHHRWFNKVEDADKLWKRDGIFLVLSGTFMDDTSESGWNSVMLEKVKYLQQRYSGVQVIGFQSCNSFNSSAVETSLSQILMNEYITFPILLSTKTFDKITDQAQFVIFKDFKSPYRCYDTDVDIGIMERAVKELLQNSEKPTKMKAFDWTWVKPSEVIKEPCISSLLKNFVLYFPGCISVDEKGDRLFLSDINHHRIVIFDSSGKFLDCIGSSPGFEDGEFETAKLSRPAGSFYNEAEDCLYFLDSENHAVRKADMQRRVLETLYPASIPEKKPISLWSEIISMLWVKGDDSAKPEEINSRTFLFPWHLLRSSNDDLLVINRSFETLWTIDPQSGGIKNITKGSSKIMEICGEPIMEKTSLLKDIPPGWLKKHDDANYVSSLASFKDYVVICDPVGHRVLKFNKGSGVMSRFNFSSFGILGLPYWVTPNLERVNLIGQGLTGCHIDHIQSFNLLPGHVDIQLNVDIPEDTEMVEPLQEGCLWRQARGSAIVFSGAEDILASSKEIGVAQQWYDELDNLTFSTPDEEPSDEEESTVDNMKEGGICIDCAIDTSPGTSEVIIYAALYLRLKGDSQSKLGSREKIVARIAHILNPVWAEKNGRPDPGIKMLLESERNLEELVFMKPLHVRLKFECGDHPKADNSKDIILTDSSIDVNVSLAKL
ncbi:uncharacterized protein LOC124935935 [Impatiens glandulifera]|uniref:uncharacterized protein LOC124935935 n=1 Tax=Impatiens glandulifera TaxID=253017 RepID=UPI001FB067CB|nr:uncharacterized protein LOC124935935 [Impatiens glandulifera]